MKWEGEGREEDKGKKKGRGKEKGEGREEDKVRKKGRGKGKGEWRGGRGIKAERREGENKK